MTSLLYILYSTQYFILTRLTTTAKKPVKKIHKHQGIYQSGPKKGPNKCRFDPGFKYSDKPNNTGLKIIIRVKKK